MFTFKKTDQALPYSLIEDGEVAAFLQTYPEMMDQIVTALNALQEIQQAYEVPQDYHQFGERVESILSKFVVKD